MSERPVWRVDRVRHPALPLIIALDERDDALVYVGLDGRPSPLLWYATRHGARLVPELRRRTSAHTQLREYLHGQRDTFDLLLRPYGTPFQQRAWQALCDIPFGETRSYAMQAQMLGMALGARAVGQANGQNPLPIVIPCHRVLGQDGSLTGFTGGTERKRWLLAFERDPKRPPLWRPGTDQPRAKQLALFGMLEHLLD